MQKFLGTLALLVVFTGCLTPPSSSPQLSTMSIPIPPLPPMRPLTVNVLKRAAPEALQYYISTWVILESEELPDYPETISVRDLTIFREDVVKIPPVMGRQGEVVEPEQSYRFVLLPDPRAVNPAGVGHIMYGNFSRTILVKEQTRGVLLNIRTDEADERMILEIGFERDNNNVLTFKEDELGEYFYLFPAESGATIRYGGYPYRQLSRERPLLMVRIEENIENTLRVHTAEGRFPKAEPRGRSPE